MSFDAIKEAIDRQGVAFDAFRKNQNERLDQISGDTAALRDRVEELESRRNSPGKTGTEVKAAREHSQLFTDWIRKPHDGGRKQALGDFQSKALSIGINADGGFAVPEEIAVDVEKLMIKLSPVRDLIPAQRTSTGDFKKLVTIGGASAGWVGESDSRSATETPQLRERVPTWGELYAYPQTTEWLLDDAFFNVRDWLTAEIAEQFAQPV